MKQTPAEAAALAREMLRLLIQNRRLKLLMALRQLDEALVEANNQNKGLVTVWKLWRGMRREEHLALRLLRLGSHLVPQDEAGITAACQTWEKADLSGDSETELLDRLTRFAPQPAWNPEKMRRVGSGCGLTPESLLQVLREKQANAGGPTQA